MADDIVEPVLVRYSGGDSDAHLIQADLFGKSILGAAKLYEAVSHYCASGFVFVPTGKYKRVFRVYASPPRDGSVEDVLRVLPAVAGEYAIYSALYNEAFSYVFARVCGAIKDAWTRPSDMVTVVDRLADSIDEQARTIRAVADVNAKAIEALDQANARAASAHELLIKTLPQLSHVTRPYGK